MKTLVIADIHSNNTNGICSGHFIPLAKMYCQLYDSIAKVFVSSGPIYKKSFSEGRLIVLPYDMIAGKSFIINRIKAMCNAYELFKHADDKIIIMQDAMPITNHLGIALFYHKKRNRKLYLIKYTTKGCQSFLGKLTWKLIKNKIDGIICPNEEVGKTLGLSYCVVPDYIYTGGNETSRNEYNKKLYDFCFVGRITREKGIIEAAKSLAATPYKTLIAGLPETNCIKELKDICNNSSNIELKLEYISDENYIRFLRQSRYCILNYQSEYSNRSSGVVYDTIFNDVPVIGKQCKALDFLEKMQIGIIYEDINNFDFNIPLCETKYYHFLEHIKQYRERHKLHKEQLAAFLGINQ